MPNLPFGVSLLLGNAMFEMHAGRISDVISFQTLDIAGVVDEKCRSESPLNNGVLSGADITVTDVDAVKCAETCNVDAVNKDCIETTAAVVTRSACKTAEMDFNGSRQVRSEYKHSSAARLRSTGDNDVTSGRLKTAIDERSAINNEIGQKLSVVDSASDLSRPEVGRGEAVSRGESFNERQGNKQLSEGVAAADNFINDACSIGGSNQKRKQHVQNRGSVSCIRESVADTNDFHVAVDGVTGENTHENLGPSSQRKMVSVNADEINIQDQDTKCRSSKFVAGTHEQTGKNVGESCQQEHIPAERQLIRDDETEECTRLARIDPSVVNSNFYLPCNVKCTAFVEEQKADNALKIAWEKAIQGKSGYFIDTNGVLMKRKPKHVQNSTDSLIVLPEKYKMQVLHKAHDSVQNGNHSGFARTATKIRKIFYMRSSEIKRYVASCSVCQRMREKRVAERAPLIQVPIMDMEFADKWVIDICGGDLPRTSRRYANKKHLLIAVDVATRCVN